MPKDDKYLLLAVGMVLDIYPTAESELPTEKCTIRRVKNRRAYGGHKYVFDREQPDKYNIRAINLPRTKKVFKWVYGVRSLVPKKPKVRIVTRDLKPKQLHVNQYPTYDFLKYYVFAVNYATVKYKISKDAIEMGMFLRHYDLVFSRPYFLSMCRLAGMGKVRSESLFRYYIENNLLELVDGKRTGKDARFLLNTDFKKKLKDIYQMAILQSEMDIDFRREKDVGLSEGVEDFFRTLNREAKEIKKGIKKPDTVKAFKPEEENQ